MLGQLSRLELSGFSRKETALADVLAAISAGPYVSCIDRWAQMQFTNGARAVSGGYMDGRGSSLRADSDPRRGKRPICITHGTRAF